MKAIIEVARGGSIFRTTAQQIATARQGRTPDFRLSFESARSLFAELTPARLDLLEDRVRNVWAPEPDKLLRCRNGQVLQFQRQDHIENRAVRADSDGERQHSKGGETRGAANLP